MKIWLIFLGTMLMLGICGCGGQVQKPKTKANITYSQGKCSGGCASNYVFSHPRLGCWSLKYDPIASTRIGNMGSALIRHVCLTDRMRSTHRLPLSLCVPLLRFRQRTPNLKARSALLLVGSTPFSSRKTHNESISPRSDRASRPASSSAPSNSSKFSKNSE